MKYTLCSHCVKAVELGNINLKVKRLDVVCPYCGEEINNALIINKQASRIFNIFEGKGYPVAKAFINASEGIKAFMLLFKSSTIEVAMLDACAKKDCTDDSPIVISYPEAESQAKIIMTKTGKSQATRLTTIYLDTTGASFKEIDDLDLGKIVEDFTRFIELCLPSREDLIRKAVLNIYPTITANQLQDIIAASR